MAQYRTVDKTTFTEIGKWTKEKIDAGVANKVDKVEGSSLATTAQLTQIETNKTDIASLKTGKADKSQLTGLASETYVDEKVANLGDLKGSCLKSELESKKAKCKENDMFIVTDDSNHIWYYNGTDFVDTSAVAHVDLSNYYDKGTVDSKLGGYVAKVSGKDLVSTSDITQITTNKNSIASLQTTLDDIKSDIGDFNTALEALL